MDRIGLFRLEPEDIAAIDIPVLAAVGAGEGPLAQCDAFSRCASGPVTKVVFTADWGADSHCQVTNVQYLGQVVYDWFADRFAD